MTEASFLLIAPHLILTFFVWLTYHYILRCGFVSDDFQGMLEYDGKLQGLEYGMISRWVRYHLCGGNFPSKIKDHNGKAIPTGKTPFRHHLLSITIFNIAVLLMYSALAPLIGGKLAIMALILLVVHPVGAQCVAWVSGLGYPLCLLWMGAILNLLGWYYAGPQTLYITMGVVVAFVALQVLAINALFIGLMLWPILAFLGYTPFAWLGIVISAMLGFQIVKSTIKFRAGEFKKQNMGASTFIKPRKLIIAAKTLAYYLQMMVMPTKLGLYHKWGYHYNEHVEREDFRTVLGLILGGLAIYGVFCGPPIVQFCILWTFGFLGIFLNWITIQQFVAERYAFIPFLGVSILACYFLQSFMWLYTFIVGVLICRTWVHLPTYDSELRFYLSNTWNFSDSEVAYGNLGVTYLRGGMVGSAMDSWKVSTILNPNYDVPFYNMYSHYKSNGAMQISHGQYQQGIELYKTALPFIESAIKCEVCHFKEQWQKERDELVNWISNPSLVVTNEKDRLEKLKKTLLDKSGTKVTPQEVAGIQQSLDDIEKRLTHIDTVLKPNGNTTPGIPTPGQSADSNPTVHKPNPTS